MIEKLIRTSLLVGLLAAGIQSSSAQIYHPAEWSFSSQRISSTEAELVLTCELEDGWHLYSQHLDDGGPIPTSFSFKELGGTVLKGEVTEPEGHTMMDPNFGMEVTYFDRSAKFVQKIGVSGSEADIKGELEFMVCNDERCLPPDIVPFEFNVPAASDPAIQTGDSEENKAETGILTPVTWTFDSRDLGSGEFELRFTAAIDKPWHVYSMHLPEEAMSVPTSFSFDTLKGAELVGDTQEPEPIKEYDPVNEGEMSFFEDTVTFTQIIKLTSEHGTVIGALNFMTCDDRRCLPPEWVDFRFELGAGEDGTAVAEAGTAVKDRSWLGIFIAGFLGGLFALLTPCVFPMIPLTVSFFTKQSKDKRNGIRNAVIYGAFIMFIYVVLGFLVTVTFGADALNALSTNVWFNIFFFLLLVIFAVSFLGAFEITLPSAWVNKADQASDKGGLVGIFFMAFTLSLVSFSCTGPIIGTLLVEAAVHGGVTGPILGMTGFSLALALPFGLFAAFPGWLNSMPKSGGWLNSVKVVLGLLELALALKFLSNADLVVQGGYLKRELFLALWIGIFGTLALYLFGFIKFPHDNPSSNISVPRYFLGLFVLVFTIYLIPGLWGAPLKIISGFPPPRFYSESPNGLSGGSSAAKASAVLSDKGDIVGDPEHCPFELPCFHDYDEGLAYAKEANKPIMLDFTGWACVNCRKMEEQVWSDPRVLKRLREDFVLISLYVDEKTPIAKEDQIEVEIGGKKKKLRTVGNRWSYMQADRFGTNSQPYYVILNLEEKQLGPSAAYNSDIQKYIDWLDSGLLAFEKDS